MNHSLLSIRVKLQSMVWNQWYFHRVVAGSIRRGENSWGLLFLLDVCLLFSSQRVQDVFPPVPSCTSVSGKRRRKGERALGEGQLNKQRERERNRRGEKPWVFLWVCHVIWADPFISGRWLFGPSGCWVSVTDEKKWAVSAGIWGRPHAKDEPTERERVGGGLDLV